MSKIYRAAAIGHTGAGDFGHDLHIAYRDLSNVEFIAIADPDQDGREKAAKQTNAKRTYADYREMLKNEEIDLVSVCPRWVTEHLEMVLACLDAGCHIYCEKPMTFTLADGDLIIETARSKNLKVAIAHQGVYLPRVQAIKKMIDDRKIGDIQAIYAHGKQDHRGGGEDMITLATHLFNMMRFFVGDPDWIFAHITENGAEVTKNLRRVPTEPVGWIAGDCVNSYFAFKSGVSGFFDSRKDQIGSNRRYGMDIVGSEGVISLRGGAADWLVIYPHANFDPSNFDQSWQETDIPPTPLMNGNRLAVLDLISAIENDRKPLSSAEDAVAALEMIHGAYESQLIGERVYFPMKNRNHPLEK